MDRSGSTRRKRSWLRMVTAFLGIILLFGGFTLWLVTRSWFITGQLQPVLSEAFGGDVTIRRAEYAGDGRFVVAGLRVQVPGLPKDVGGAGELLSIGRAVVQVDSGRLFRGSVVVQDIVLGDVLIRLSEDRERPGSFNFMKLAPVPPENETGLDVLPPSVRIENALVEIGSHDSLGYAASGSRSFSGSMLPRTAQGRRGEWFEFRLVEIEPRGDVNEQGIIITGDWNVRTNEHTLRMHELTLDEEFRSLCPQVVRLWWEKMELDGKVSNVVVTGSGGERWSVDFDIADVDLKLPIDASEIWARYHDGAIEPALDSPRMTVAKGTLHLAQHEIELINLQGELTSAGASMDDAEERVVGVPYAVSLHITEIPELDWNRKGEWLDDVLLLAPFHLEFQTRNFRIQRDSVGRVPAVELPLVVARVLERFRLTDWTLTTGIVVDRPKPILLADGTLQPGEVVSHGQAHISDASGSYRKFPYPLHNVDGHLEFDNDRITIDYVRGRGSGGATVRLGGEIAPPSRHGGVKLTITARNAPVDEQLRSALNPSQQKAFDMLLHRPSYDALDQAGLLINEENIESARVELLALRDARNTAHTDRIDEESVQELEQAIARLESRIAAGPTKLGGTVDLDLKLERPMGDGMRSITTGLVTIHDLGLIYEKFPYPIVIPSGKLNWREEYVEIASDPDRAVNGAIPGGDFSESGLPILTAAGGRGTLSGKVYFEREEDGHMQTRPDFTIDIEDDPISDLLLAVIPPSKSTMEEREASIDWQPGSALSESAQWIDAIGLAGLLNYEARIFTDSSDQPRYDIAVELRDGVLAPGPALGDLLQTTLSITEGLWRMEDAHAALRITPEAITLRDFTGRHAHGMIGMTGLLDLAASPPTLDLAVQLREMQIGRYLLSLVSPDDAPTAEQWWQRYEPSGSFDATVAINRTGSDRTSEIEIRPHQLVLGLPDGLIDINCLDGVARIAGGALTLEEMSLDVAEPGESVGRIELDGAIALGTRSNHAHALQLSGKWTGARMESPLVTELLDRIGATAHAEHYRSLRPEGEFDALFNVDLQDETRVYRVEVEPKAYSFMLRETPLFGVLADGASVVFMPGRIALNNIRGSLSDGSFQLDGVLQTASGIDAQLQFEYDGHISSPQVRALLPNAVTNLFDAIELVEPRPSVLKNGRLHLARNASGNREDADPASASDAQPEWAVDFDGRLMVDDASFLAGVEFSGVSGPFDIHSSTAPGSMPEVLVHAQPRTVTLVNQQLEEVSAFIELVENGRAVQVRDFAGAAGDGLVTASARVGVRDDPVWQVGLDLAAVPLSGFMKTAAEDVELSAPSSSTQDIDSRGGAYASMEISGRRGEPQSRYGRGVVRVIHGRIADLPLALQLVQAVQLTLPSAGFSYFNCDFYIDGNRAWLEDIRFEATHGRLLATELLGEGVIDLESWEIDARFRSRAGVAVLRDLVGVIGDQIAAIEVTGPISTPNARLIVLPSDWERSAAAHGRESIP